MPGKHYKKLGKTKIVRLPEEMEAWIKIMARKLDDKKNPQELMDFLTTITDKIPWSKMLIGNQKSDRITEIVNNCFGKSVLEVEKYFA